MIRAVSGRPAAMRCGVRILLLSGVASANVNGEDLAALHVAMSAALAATGPYALVIKRNMCPGMGGVEGTCNGHDAVAKSNAVAYLTGRGHKKAVDILNAVKTTKDPYSYLGGGAMGAPRQIFGTVVGDIVKAIPAAERAKRVVVIDSDLEGSCGLAKIREAVPECYISGGIMERGNFSACAGFGFGGTAGTDRQAIFATFAAFQEMILSEVTMARLNFCNVLCHFSHSGVDDMSDNMCHFGQNNLFADNGLEDESTPKTQLFFPADVRQMAKVVQGIFWEKGLRFVYSTRSKVPEMLKPDGTPYFGESYQFVLGRDDLIIGHGEACDGYVVSYSDALYRAVDAVTRLRAEGMKVGLVNKCHVNVPDDDMLATIGESRFVVVVESQSTKTGLGLRLGTWLLERGHTPKFARVGTHTDGSGGTWEQAYAQGYDPESIMGRVRSLAAVKNGGAGKNGKGEKPKGPAQQGKQTPEEKAAAQAIKDATKLREKIIKEGGKKGVEIEGASDMGGLDFFCTTMELPEGNLDFLELSMLAMNAEADPEAEDRKGCSGHIGKMIYSAGVEQLAMVAYVPGNEHNKSAEKVDITKWMNSVMQKVGGCEVVKGETVVQSLVPHKQTGSLETGTKGKIAGKIVCAVAKSNPETGKFALKDKDLAMAAAFSYLRSVGAFPEEGDDDSDDMIFGDDDNLDDYE